MISVCVFKIPRTGCREYYPGQWTYGWTGTFGSQRWYNFDDAWAACQSLGAGCGSLSVWFDHYSIKSGTGINTTWGGAYPNMSLA